jgi:hypothetical protein
MKALINNHGQHPQRCGEAESPSTVKGKLHPIPEETWKDFLESKDDIFKSGRPTRQPANRKNKPNNGKQGSHFPEQTQEETLCMGVLFRPQNHGKSEP